MSSASSEVVVEHLRGEGVGAARDEQVGELLGQRMLAAPLLAMTDHTIEQREGIVPVIHELRRWIGPVIEQQRGDLDRVGFGAGEAAIGEIQDRLPVERAALLLRGGGVLSEMALHFVEVAEERGGMDRVARETGHARAKCA